MIEPVDLEFLARALALARQGGRSTCPNPRVGAVVARGGVVLAEGWHQRAGEQHAEAEALQRAGVAARGATLYTTLEPCNHHGRTPPCCSAILDAGISRVVVGLIDPDPRVAGGGIARLRGAGLTVEVVEGEMACRAAQTNEDYLIHRRLGRAFCALKVAATLDGKIADRRGVSRWITGDAARKRGRELRDWYGAILVGAGTVLADDPLLLPPGEMKGHPPFLRCVVDGGLRISPRSRLFHEGHPEAPVLVFSSRQASPSAWRELERAGAEVVALPVEGGRIPVRLILEELGRRGVLGLLVEGGGETHAQFLEQGMADKVYWFAAPQFLVDREARAAVAGGPRFLDAALRMEIAEAEPVGDDILLTLYPRGVPGCSPDWSPPSGGSAAPGVGDAV